MDKITKKKWDECYEDKEKILSHEIAESVLNSTIIEDSDLIKSLCQDNINRNNKYSYSINHISKYEFFHGNMASYILSLGKFEDEKTVILYDDNKGFNFADYEYETLSQEVRTTYFSNIPNIESRFKFYYEYKYMNMKDGLYDNRAIYIPQVSFVPEYALCQYRYDVISCASPNIAVAYLNEVSFEQFDVCLRERIDFILAIATIKKADTLLLYDWGRTPHQFIPYRELGPSRASAEQIASIFSEFLNDKYYGSFRRVVFCIVDKLILDKFRNILTGHEKQLHG